MENGEWEVGSQEVGLKTIIRDFRGGAEVSKRCFENSGKAKTPTAMRGVLGGVSSFRQSPLRETCDEGLLAMFCEVSGFR